MSVANQKVITIHKSNTTTPPFVQVNERDWHEAFINLTRTAFAVYLYLAQNQNGYTVEYSPQAIENLGLMNKSTASKAINELIQKEYVVNGVFYTESATTRRQKEQLQSIIKRTVGQS